MKIIIEADAKEIADLVLKLQNQLKVNLDDEKILLNGRKISQIVEKANRDISSKGQ